jgi:pyruvate,orthophosphate dikinase
MVSEMKAQKDLIREAAQETMKRYNVKPSYLVGTMIELPRAAVTADRIATEAEFFHSGRTTSPKPRSVSPATMRRSSSMFIRTANILESILRGARSRRSGGLDEAGHRRRRKPARD